jgi:hypothetical protein
VPGPFLRLFMFLLVCKWRKQERAERREGKGREGKGREGKGREGKGREGKGREGKGKEGERDTTVLPFSISC